ncbi:hypothetical protein Rumeso_05002 [Rubellimicrobium mesophilum DSM 19309]|uniref:Twin-arginine translocation pathway signal n=1 Tax=Rubellimicrobium mesophilum DSM 19309 TaxID=442562 RepID=A0A017HB63_9RHOB|nr:hypothetical protein [Rubellimicrobium mesophilum]EYD71601.1 hypothetical protein Rumeso_05002 [Rubellimicrobium mesophilum DSM 19309]
MNVTSQGAGFQPTTRRALMKGALAAPAALVGAPALASTDTPIMQLFREFEDMEGRINDHATSSEEADRLYPILRNLEDRMAEEPVTCLADLAAKVLALTTLRDEVGSIYDPGVLAECEALVKGAAQ